MEWCTSRHKMTAQFRARKYSVLRSLGRTLALWPCITYSASGATVLTDTLFYALTPCRILDTRNLAGALGGPSLVPGATRTFNVGASSCGIPPGATAVSGNLTVTNVGAGGELVVFPPDVPQPKASAISFAAGRTRANNALIGLSNTSATFSVFNNSPAPVDFILDVVGYFSPTGRYRLPVRGLFVAFERRGYPNDYAPGQVIQQFNDFDSIVGHAVKDEVALQLDAMKDMGVNVITCELRTADPTYIPGFVPPTCNSPPVNGFQWPQPTATELTNLRSYLDLIQAKGIQVHLSLVNTHMEEQPPTNSATWLGAIFAVIKDHPAIDLILLVGDTHLEWSSCQAKNACGIPAEAPLWNGPGDITASYIRWAITHAMSFGIPARKLSTEAIVGAYNVDSEPGNCIATDGHMWSPIVTLKRIFDDLAIPDAQRTYALSFYEHRKCFNTSGLVCIDAPPYAWAEESLQRVLLTIGLGSGARVVASEMGANSPVDPGWPTERSLESLVFLMEKYGIAGGSFWRWTNYRNADDADPTTSEPVKKRGVAFIYNKAQKEVLDMGGFHLTVIPNGSFEKGGTLPDLWSVTGSGTASRYFLAGEPGQPEVPSRGSYDLRLITGGGLNGTISARGQTLSVTQNVTYTTTANLRFAWSGDPNPLADPSTRPQVFVAFHYFDGLQQPSSIRAQDTFRFFQEDSTQRFSTFPLRYTTPADARSVQIEIGVARNGLTMPITLDADNLR